MTDAEAGQRLDRYLRKLLRHVPLGAIMKHLRSGRIRVDGSRAKGSLRLAAGMAIKLDLSEGDLSTVAEAGERRSDAVAVDPELRIRVVHADDDVLVVEKPAGVAVHGGGSNDRRSLTAWLDTYGRGLRTATFAPAPAHRLDRDTSGLVAVGLTPRGLAGLTAAFREDRVRKVYLAVVEGRPSPERGTIDAALLAVDSASAREPKVVVDAAGKAAVTDYETVTAGPRQTLLRLRLRTGRTHQIRVHLAHLGHPVVGDVRYGRAAGRGGRLLLHALELDFEHPVSGKRLRLRSPASPEFRAAVC